MNPKGIKLEYVVIENGDHVLVVMDRALNIDINDFASWGKNAVIVDAWSGEAFPATNNDLTKKIMAYQYDLSQSDGSWGYNFLMSFNPKFHKLKVKFDNNCVPTTTAKSSYIEFSQSKNVSIQNNSDNDNSLMNNISELNSVNSALASNDSEFKKSVNEQRSICERLSVCAQKYISKAGLFHPSRSEEKSHQSCDSSQYKKRKVGNANLNHDATSERSAKKLRAN